MLANKIRAGLYEHRGFEIRLNERYVWEVRELGKDEVLYDGYTFDRARNLIDSWIKAGKIPA